MSALLIGTVAGISLVYKIPYRRARAWPSGCIGRVRRASKGILHTSTSLIHPMCLYWKLYGEPLVTISKTIGALFHMASDLHDLRI